MFKETIREIKYELDEVNNSLGDNDRPNSYYKSLKKIKKTLKHLVIIRSDYDDYALDICLEQIKNNEFFDGMKKNNCRKITKCATNKEYSHG